MTPLDLIDDAETVAPKLGRKRDHSRDPEILDAALQVLAEEGYDGMTIDMVATRARAGKATLYRRWPSKAELVLDAVVCMKGANFDKDVLPDTGTLRGDLIAMIKSPSLRDAAKKLQIMAGVVSMLSRAPELAEAVRAAIVEPRVAANRMLMTRAVERGEVSADRDIETIAQVSPSMVAHRVLMTGEPVTREYLIGVIDGVVLPALGVSATAERPEG